MKQSLAGIAAAIVLVAPGAAGAQSNANSCTAPGMSGVPRDEPARFARDVIAFFTAQRP